MISVRALVERWTRIADRMKHFIISVEVQRFSLMPCTRRAADDESITRSCAVLAAVVGSSASYFANSAERFALERERQPASRIRGLCNVHLGISHLFPARRSKHGGKKSGNSRFSGEAGTQNFPNSSSEFARSPCERREDV